jgi:Protein of unknown function with HXXEE motif
MDIKDLSIWLLAFTLIIHTIEEGWLPEYLKVKPNWRSVLFNRPLFLENLPVFIFSIVLGMVGFRYPILGGILPAVGLTHPLLDHLGLSWKTRHLRPGSWTGLFLLLPLSIWTYFLSNSYHLFKSHELLISGMVGLAISLWLFWMVDQEIQRST